MKKMLSAKQELKPIKNVVMKKNYTKRLLEESLSYLNKLITADSACCCYREPIISTDCPNWNKETADYIRDEQVKFYVTSWIIPNIEKAIKELSK